MMTANFTKEQAKQVDAKLAEDQRAYYKALERQESAVRGVAHFASSKTLVIARRSYPSFDGKTVATAEEASQRGAELRASRNLQPWDERSFENYMGKLAAAMTEVAALRESIEAAHTMWEDHGRWSRFFLVTGGHIHSSTHCHTLRFTTRLGWLPELSGETEKDAVDAHGALLCTVCFPSAPVEWTNGSTEDDDKFCAGGRPTDADFRRRSPYGTCPTCGQTVSVTSTGKARKHKKDG